jgi:hypothetical protein
MSAEGLPVIPYTMANDIVNVLFLKSPDIQVDEVGHDRLNPQLQFDSGSQEE